MKTLGRNALFFENRAIFGGFPGTGTAAPGQADVQRSGSATGGASH